MLEMPEEALIVEGGTLIDGTGRKPVENASILIRGQRIAAIGVNGDIPRPENAKVVNVAGKTILPGFIDGHGHLEDFHGELYLHLGITTCAQIELYQDGPWSLAQKEGTALGKIHGPRIWMTGRGIGGPLDHHEAFGSRTLRGNIVVRTEEEARAAVRRKHAMACEIIKLNEFLPAKLTKVVIDEAHSLGLAVAAHSLDAIETASLGVDAIEHIWAVGYSTILYAPARRRLAEDRLGGKIDQEIVGAYYQTENYDRVIAALVENGVAWTPTIAKWLRPLSPSAERFRERERQILEQASLPPAVRTVTDNAYEKLFQRYTPEQLDFAKIGYEKTNEFIRRFVEAGGILKEGSDPPRGMAALLMHQALVMDVEAGVSPMMAIQAATLNVAKAFHKDDDYGSIEVGKVADLSIIEGDPLKDIWATQRVCMVVLDGRMVDIAFKGYKNPIPSFYSYQALPSDLEISPRFVREGSGSIILSVWGREMWPFHRVYLGDKELATNYVSRTQLDATIPAEMISEAGTFIVTVRSVGEPLAQSNRAHLIVGFSAGKQ